MRASELCKQLGLKDLNQVVDTVKISRHTLRNWHMNRPLAFRAIVLGAKEMIRDDGTDTSDTERSD